MGKRPRRTYQRRFEGVKGQPTPGNGALRHGFGATERAQVELTLSAGGCYGSACPNTAARAYTL
jgi:hypothetical protein